MTDEPILRLFNPVSAMPDRLNNPFDYEPHAVAREAFAEVLPAITRLMEGREGKMFGVLVVTDTDNRPGYLVAYSGQIDGSGSLPGYAPMVFDYLEPDGYFKTHENEIVKMGKEIDRLSKNTDFIEVKHRLQVAVDEAEKAVARQATLVKMAKKSRDQRRIEGYLSVRELDEMKRESQYLKAELHRTKLREAAKVDEARAEVERHEQQINALKAQRKQRSDALQQWLFTQTIFENYKGEHRSLADLFADTVMQIPPSGAGECCEPKLLNYAYTHRLTPRSMAMFWVGPSPRHEVRHHLQHYPACSGKCKPILQWMLPPEVLSDADVEGVSTQRGQLRFLYEDDALVVVGKPSGMLSVPGKSRRESVVSIVSARCQDCCQPLVVHRLDMDTSGIMLLAKTPAAQKALQKQFLDHRVRKTYVAVVEGDPLEVGAEGEISIPLSPDPLNRPYQTADYENGKTAVTTYRALGPHLLELHPLTGRTHQLRVHCAHADGLHRPIKGDRLYGRRADRLYLHARSISFLHPTDGTPMDFEWEADWNE